MLSLVFLPGPCHSIFYSPYSLTRGRQRGHCYSSSFWRYITWVCHQARSFNSITQKYIIRGLVFSWCIDGVLWRNAKWQRGCTCSDPYECKLARTCLQPTEIWESQVFSRLIEGYFMDFSMHPYRHIPFCTVSLSCIVHVLYFSLKLFQNLGSAYYKSYVCGIVLISSTLHNEDLNKPRDQTSLIIAQLFIFQKRWNYVQDQF